MPSVAGTADLSTTVPGARQRSSSPTDAVPDPLQDPNTLDFEKELTAALRLDTDSQAGQFAKLDFPSLPDSPRTSIHSTAPTLGNVQFDSEPNEVAQEEINLNHVHPESTRLSVAPDSSRELVVKTQGLYDHSDAERRPTHHPVTGEDHESKEDLCPSSSLSYTSDTAPSRSLPYTSNVTVVLASKAVRADELSVLINGLPTTAKAGKFPALDNQVVPGENIPVENVGGPRHDAQGNSHERQPDNPTLQSINSERVGEVSDDPNESKNDSRTGRNGPPVSLGGHSLDQNGQIRHIRSVSSLDTLEAAPSFVPGRYVD